MPRLPHLVAAAALLCGPLLCAAQRVQVVSTSADLTSALAPGPTLAFSATSPRSMRPQTLGPIINVDERQRFQTMDGFGASMTDGSAWLIEQRLPPVARTQVMSALFDPVRGIGLSFLREPIGSTDLSRTSYSFDPMPAGQQDPAMRHFSAAHDDAELFPAVRQALRLNPAITVMATPWSPPAWMKTRPTMDGGALRDDAMAAYAAYLVRSVQAFQVAGIPIKYLTVQNEPLNETHDYPGTLMLAAQEKRFIARNLGPALRGANLSTQVLAYDHNWDHPEYPLAILSDPAAAQYVAGTAFHCYGGDASAQSEVHRHFAGKGVWMTECSGGTWQQESPLHTTAHLLIDSTRNWARAVVLWGIALDTGHGPHDGGCGTCRGLVTVDLKASPASATYTGDYYALGQASRFVHPGATRIASTSSGRTSLETVAFQNPDGSIALLALNNRAESTQFAVVWHGRAFQADLAAGALATYLWRAKSAQP